MYILFDETWFNIYFIHMNFEKVFTHEKKNYQYLNELFAIHSIKSLYELFWDQLTHVWEKESFSLDHIQHESFMNANADLISLLWLDVDRNEEVLRIWFDDVSRVAYYQADRLFVARYQ